MKGQGSEVRKRMGKSVGWLFNAIMLGMVALFVTVPGLIAQTTSTNAVDLISDNVEYARDTLVPIAIGALVLFIGIAAGVKFWKRIYSK